MGMVQKLLNTYNLKSIFFFRIKNEKSSVQYSDTMPIRYCNIKNDIPATKVKIKWKMLKQLFMTILINA